MKRYDLLPAAMAFSPFSLGPSTLGFVAQYSDDDHDAQDDDTADDGIQLSDPATATDDIDPV